MKNHVMLDLETLGTKSNSIILSVGMIVFDPMSFAVNGEFKVNISLDSSKRYGFNFDTRTIQWWMEQNAETFRKQLKDGIHIKAALGRIHKFIEQNNISHIWGNSAAFDIGLLRNYFERCTFDFPVNFRNELCYRTVRSLYWTNEAKQELEAIGLNLTKHDPLHDCLYQVAFLQLLVTRGIIILPCEND